MKDFQAVQLDRIHQVLRWSAIPEFIGGRDEGGEKVISLSLWVQHTLMESTTRALFGETLQKVEPNVVQALARYDEDSWKFTYQIPAAFSRSMLSAKAVVQDAIFQYFELPLSERADACWMVTSMEAEMRALGATSKDVSASMMLLYWVANTNAWKAAFWMLARILHDLKLKQQVEREIDLEAIATLSPADLQLRLDSLPLLNAVYYEVLRTTASSISVRDVLSDCVIGSFKLQKGSRLIVPFRQMLLDSTVFPSPEVFSPERFLHNPSLAMDPSFRPFGGGTTFCPGRFVAQQMATTMVALVLSRFRIEPREPEILIPECDEKKPCLGVMEMKDGEDVTVVVRRRVQ